ncbi:hypothetical protein RASY3_14165 [Ruminococcus albus SY3]|uniref:Uncharacterized protein n=1 Tax=Ruminococcus albus SY3 TaxID=1341156 RepID=A0A011VTA9_RUMAL|nr:hypothetical protein [Ruminococcus albus]EXM38481.1 hypothetical protein RASY3_14165 [Ruminococcus albus SY3]
MGNKIVYKGYDVGETTQVSIMPTATADNSGAIVQYVGATNANYINGYFYKCVSDGGVTPTYSWEKMQVSDGGDGTPHWSGTRAEYEAIKDTLEAGTIVNITDDYDDGLEVVDVVEEDNMNPVTSNAVANAIQIPQPYWTAKVQAWAVGDIDVIFTAPTGKKFIFGTGSVLDNRRAFVTVMDEAPIVSADGKTITIKFYTYSLGGAQPPTECTVYLNALVIDE